MVIERNIRGFDNVVLFNTELKKYYNDKTDKWVKNLRPSNIKSNKGLTPYYGWMVETITDEELSRISKDYDLKEDGIISIITMILINGCNIKDTRKDIMWKYGWVQLKSQQLKMLIGSDYKRYIDVLVKLNIVSVYNKYLEGTFCKRYKINGLFDETHYYNITMRKIQYRTDKFNKRVFKFREHIKNIKDATKNNSTKIRFMETREWLLEQHRSMLQNINPTLIDDWLNTTTTYWDNKYEKNPNLDRHYPNRVYYNLISLKDNIQELYYNISDDFGHRFHSAWTNTPAWSKVLLYNSSPEKPLYELDIVNSQFYFFSLICKINSKKLKSILTESLCVWDGKELLKYKRTYNKKIISTIETIKVMYNMYEDIQMFVEQSINGTLYEWLATKLNIKRSKVKILLFHALFSMKNQNNHKKISLRKVIPNVVKMFELLNGVKKDNKKYGSKLLQKIESHVIIDMTCGKLKISNLNHSITTIHDSFVVYGDSDLETVEKCLVASLNDLNVPTPKFTIKNITMESLDGYFKN